MRGDKNREGLAEIANPAMVEFATHSNYPFRPFGDGVHAGRKNEASISFQGSCKCFAGVFYFRSGAYRICSGRPVGAEPFQILLHFMGSAQKSFQTQIWNPQPPIISRNFPFPNFSDVKGERGRLFCAVRVAGRGQGMGKCWKGFCKSVLTFLGKYVFWGIIEIKQRNYNDNCISRFFALLPRVFSGAWG